MNQFSRHKEKETEYIEKLVSVRRVAKVIKGGKRFAFSALVIVGDGKGRVGFSTGKAREVPDAIRKATDSARKNLIRIPLRNNRTLHHDIRGQAGAASVYMRAAPAGTGIIAGGPVRAIFEALGINDIVSKSTGTNNPINMVRAAIDGLQKVVSPRLIAHRRGKKVSDIIGRREGDSNHESN